MHLGIRILISQHPGGVRSSTEDWAVGESRGERAACALCDGMGGMRHGDRAARAVAERFVELCLHDARSLAAAWPPSVQRVQLELAVVMARLQAELRERRVATTFTGVAVEGRRMRLYHVGDSRAYLLRKGGWQQLSVDHRVSEDRPQLLSQALGSPQHDRLECRDVLLEDDDRLLLCSDGFSQAGMGPEELALLLSPVVADAQVPALLQEEALRRRAEDNLSLIWLVPGEAA